MAKELPYFKFFCSEWNDGDITLEDFKTQGLFINICSYYWSNECDLTFKTLKKKFKHNTDDIDYLLSEGLIKCLDDNLSISFLDEQKLEREKQSKVKSKGGKASAEARRLKKLEQESNTILTENEQVLNLSSTETQVLKEDKKREDKNNKKDIIDKFLFWFNGSKGVYTGKEGKYKVLTDTDYNNLKKLKESYTNEDFKKAIPNLFKNQWAKDTNNQSPSHFLRVENFNKYLNASEEVVRKDWEW